MKGICKLCNCEKTLKKSHIVPEFMFKNIYDNKPKRFFTIIIDLIDKEKSLKKIEQMGICEYLLCGNCEGVLSKYEKYAAETIYGKGKRKKSYIINANAINDLGLFTYQCQNINYTEFRLFLLSLLWRLSISQTFNTPDICDEKKEILREAILNRNPLNYDDFGCLLQIIMYDNNQVVKGIITQPYMTNSKNNPLLNILIDGIMYSFFLNSKNLPENEKGVFIKQNGSLTMIGRYLNQDKELASKIAKSMNFIKPQLKN